MINIMLADGKIIEIKATEAEWCEKSRMIKLFNDSQIVAEINIDNVVGWIDTDFKAESEKANKLSQNIIEHARRVYPQSINYTGRLTNEQFCEIEKECDIDFYKLGSQDTRYTIRYKGESWEV